MAAYLVDDLVVVVVVEVAVVRKEKGNGKAVREESSKNFGRGKAWASKKSLPRVGSVADQISLIGA
jgi:hypothetical protein